MSSHAVHPRAQCIARTLSSGCDSTQPIQAAPSSPHQQQQQLSLKDCKAWLVSTAALVLNATPDDDGLAIFFQTDIKVDGAVLNKAYLVQKAAEETGHALLWHKIVCRVAPGTPTYSRPAYHHMLCFSRGVRLHDVGASSTADVLPTAGDTTWARGMGTAACTAACRFVKEHTCSTTVVDPFCGHGTVLAVANSLGLDAIGVELSAKRARQAKRLSVDPEGLLLSRGGRSRDGRDNGNPSSSNSTCSTSAGQQGAGSNGSEHQPSPAVGVGAGNEAAAASGNAAQVAPAAPAAAAAEAIADTTQSDIPQAAPAASVAAEAAGPLVQPSSCI